MTPTIEASGLTKRFGKTVALDGLDLVAEPGQVLAVLGPNGAARRPSSAPSPPCSAPTRASCGWPATTSAASPRRCGG
jgi:hypothetical protein